MTALQVDKQSIQQIDGLGRLFAGMANTLTPLVKRGMAVNMRRAMTQYRREVSGKFKVKRSKVGNSFKWYVDGDTIDTVRAGVFTRWVAAPVYERGLNIVGKGAMAVPINPKAYTKDGRVKKKWRDPRNFENLYKLVTRRGTVLLMQNTKVIKTDRMARKFGVEVGAARAVQPMFVLLRSTRRRPVLRFLRSMEQYLMQGLALTADSVDSGLHKAMERI